MWSGALVRSSSVFFFFCPPTAAASDWESPRSSLYGNTACDTVQRDKQAKDIGYIIFCALKKWWNPGSNLAVYHYCNLRCILIHNKIQVSDIRCIRVYIRHVCEVCLVWTGTDIFKLLMFWHEEKMQWWIRLGYSSKHPDQLAMNGNENDMQTMFMWHWI